MTNSQLDTTNESQEVSPFPAGDLKPDTTVRSFSGARVHTIEKRLSEFNIDACKTTILQVGGNDADNGVDLDTFSENCNSSK